ncbi:sensor histidine kinase [Streptomyces uncialis]|uniref:sensor histidine kinase n=1 Tax=Streptomyces uncialis TaxID=1048205 RepID=UPI003866EE95|nr:histidine kinase [Streptomyces uncialis]
MREPGAWWQRKSTTAKVETYTRWSFHAFAVIELGVIGVVPITAMPVVPGATLLVLVLVHVVVGSLTVSRAMDWATGTRDRPLGLLITLAVTTAVVAVVGLVVGTWGQDLDRPGTPEEMARLSATGSFFLGVLAFGLGIFALAVRGPRRIAACVTLSGVAAGAAFMAVGFSPGASVVTGLLVVVFSGFFALTAVFSMWLLRAVLELDEARETRAALAVAEERLRFGRDLHDVLGRNLAVVALKSELAVQLARRERPEAVEQMIEVQRIAQESQREVREVVRGYREADLSAELAGAQGVLTAAGIDCRVTGSAGRLPAGVQSVLGWVVRETTTNVLRHGDAAHCAVTLTEADGTATLIVESDGVTATDGTGPADGTGPDDGGPAVGSGGTGLAGLRERLARVDGTLEAGIAGVADRVGGRVFRVVARVPVGVAGRTPGHASGRTPGSTSGPAPGGASVRNPGGTASVRARGATSGGDRTRSSEDRTRSSEDRGGPAVDRTESAVDRTESADRTGSSIDRTESADRTGSAEGETS